MAKDEDVSSQQNDDDEVIPLNNPRHRDSIAFKRAVYRSPEEIWNLFSEAEDCCDIIDYFNALVKALNINPSTHGLEFYEILKSKLTSWKCQSLWDLLNVRLKHSEYQQGTAAKGKKCIVIGAGPIGLRTAIEALLLGCQTVIVEKRDEFSRNNVLHLWPFLMTDFRNLGAKKFHGKFGAGCIEHINIRTLQCILMKVALILGVEIYVGVCFKELVEPPSEDTGWKATYEPENHVLSKFEFDIIIGADGKRNVLPGFQQIELRGALAIGITCNFVNNNTIEEARVNEISGISYQYNQDFFKQMEAQYGVRLENIVYYKDETHYFVMTALKASLLKLGVIKQDFADPKELLMPSNTDKERLIQFTRSAVNYATDHELPEDLEFKQLSNGNPDIALFDFTSIKKASNASRIIERRKRKLLLALVGDSLIEPFWPTGSGAGRGVLSALDTAWLIKQFSGPSPPLAVMRERENIYKLLSGTTNDSLQKNHKAFTIDPKTRYSAFDSKKVSNMSSLKSLYDTDDTENADFSVMSPVQLKEAHHRRAQARRRLSSGGSASKKKTVSTHVHPHGQGSTKLAKRRVDRSPLKEPKPVSVGNTKQFWEEHNKKSVVEKSKEHVPLKKQLMPPTGEDESMEEWSEIDDDAVAEVAVFVESPKEKTPRSGRSSKKNLKDHSKHQNNDSKDKSLMRRKSRDHLLKKQKSREDHSPTKAKSGKAKTPDKEHPRKRIGSQSKKESKKLKVPTKQQEPPRPMDAKGFFRKWFEKITDKNEEGIVDEKDTEEEGKSVLGLCTQTAAYTVMALPLMLDCNRPPKRRTTDIKLKDLQLAQQNFLLPSDDRKESQDILLKRAGSVKHTIAKLKMKVESEKPESNYYDFLKKNRADGYTDMTNGNKPIELQQKDFTPKQVIDVEKALLTNEQEEKQQSRVSKNTKSSDGDLELALQEFCAPQDPIASVLMLKVLYNIHKRIDNEPNVGKYYRVYIKGTVFEKYVWSLRGSEKFLFCAGWVKCGNYIILSKSYPVRSNLKVIEHSLRQKNKSGSLNSVRRTRSNVGDTTIVEDELVASFTNIETDSAIDSGVDDGDEIKSSFQKNKLRRVESREHLLGDEEYVVVDFIGNLEVSSRKSSKVDPPEPAVVPPSPHSPAITDEHVSPAVDGDNVFETKDEQENDDNNPDESYTEEKPDDPPDLPKEKDDPPDVPKETESKEKFVAGKGLKALRLQQQEEKQQKTKGKPQVPHEKPHDLDEKQEKLVKKTSDDSENSVTVIRSSSNRDIEKDNETQIVSRSSSTRSSSSEKGIRPSSVVMQNKMLFDQQIANQMKGKHSTESRNKRSSQVDLSTFERQRNEGSLKDKKNNSIRSLNELPVSGTVAGARSMFESGNIKPITPVGSRKSSIQSGKQVDVALNGDISLQPENPLLQKYKSDEVVQSAPKKKRFPFKKKKQEKSDESPTKLKIEKSSKQSKTNDPELLHFKNNEEHYEERPVDVPEVLDTEKGETEKKKKGLFSRMKRHSQKISEPSDSERKLSVDKAPIQRTLSAPKMKESDEAFSDDTQEPLPSNLPLNLKVSRSNTETSLPTPDVPPPSPGYASSEIKSVLENIIDRKPSFNNADETATNGEGTPKKKRLGFKSKKKSSSKKVKETSSNERSSEAPEGENVDSEHNIEGNANVPENVESDENPSLRLVVDEDVPIQIIQTDDVISDWPSVVTNGEENEDELQQSVDIIEIVDEEISEDESCNNHKQRVDADQEGAVEGAVEDESNDLKQHDIIEAIAEDFVAMNDRIPKDVSKHATVQSPLLEDASNEVERSQPVKITVTASNDDTIDGKVEQKINTVNGNCDVLPDHHDNIIMLEHATPPASPTSDYSPSFDDNASINTDISSISSGKKKKKLHFHFPRRKSSKKDKKEKQQDEIWEETPEKRNSKKLKRPKSLDFLVEKVHHHGKKSEKSNRPMSMSPGDFDNLDAVDKESVQKSPKTHKKINLSIFKKKKKHTDPVDVPKTEVKVENNGYPSSPTSPSPDPFTIPDVDGYENAHSDTVDGENNTFTNGNVTVNVDATL